MSMEVNCTTLAYCLGGQYFKINENITSIPGYCFNNTIFVKMRQNAHFETTTTCKTSKIVVEAKEKYIL